MTTFEKIYLVMSVIALSLQFTALFIQVQDNKGNNSQTAEIIQIKNQ